MIEVVDSKPKHINEIVPDLRDLHLREVAITGLTPKQVMWKCYRPSVIRRTALYEGRAVAIWGCAGTLLGGRGEPWLFATNEAVRLKFSLLRVVRGEIDAMARVYGMLGGIVNSENTVACQFLERLGFKMGREAWLPTYRHFALNREG